MTSSVYLVRHAAHGELGERLSGRGPAPGLSERGRAEAQRLRAFLASDRIDLIQASPRARAQETARAVASDRGIEPETTEALDEVDFGDWTGQRYAELNGTPEWDAWNANRASARTPRGESMTEAQQRALGHVEAIGRGEPGRAVALVSHCDIIRAVLCGVMGLSLDNILKFEIDPASVSRLSVGTWGATVHSINEGVRG